MIGFLMESDRNPNASTIECAKRGAEMAEELIKRDTIEELYDRLNQIGYTKEYLRKYALPDWWSDEVDADPLCLFECASYIQGLTGLSITDLLTPGHPLSPTPDSTRERTRVAMRDRYSAGETVEELMEDYGLDERAVEIILGIHY